jgi:uncharacterized protein (DUF736 family)
VADFKSEWPRSNRNQWPTSFRNRRPTSPGICNKISKKAPDYRVYTAGQRYEIGAGWSQVAKTSGEIYLSLRIGCPEFGSQWVRCRLVKLEQPAEDDATHIALWEPRDR